MLPKKFLLPLILLPCTGDRLLSQQNVLPIGTALQIEVDHAFRIHRGGMVTGHLTQPVYLYDHEVLPRGAMVSGTVEGLLPGPRSVRIRRLLAADFTPPKVANVVFTQVSPAPGQATPSYSLYAPAEQTDATVLTIGKQSKRRSMKQEIATRVEEAKSQARDTIKRRNWKEIVAKWAVGQLPYHPEIVWSRTRFDARLEAPVSLNEGTHVVKQAEDLHGQLPAGTLHARLLSSVSSSSGKRGDAVEAVMTQPLFSPDGQKLLVPEGTLLHGHVVQVRPARSFGRSGSLRFTFSKLDLHTTNESSPIEVHGQLSAAEMAGGEHVTMDEEGQVKATGGPAKYAEPALLAVLAASAAPDGDHPGTSGPGASAYASNGLGLIARVVSLTTRDPNVVQGFAYYSLAKSVYFRFLAKGPETTFLRDTELQVTLSER